MTASLPPSERARLLRSLLSRRVLVLDGAMGTMIQGHDLGPDDFGGPAYEGCPEMLNLTRPDVIRAIHAAYLEAGADIVETNSFGSTPLVLGEYGLAERAYELSREAARLARLEAERFSTAERPRFVAGSMGPTTRSLTVTGGVTFDQLRRHYGEQARGLVDGGADYLLVETAQDTRNVKAALVAIGDLGVALGRDLPVAVSATIEATGTMLAGQGAEALVASLSHLPLLYLGLNCATGPEAMTDHLRALSELARTPVACVPNAGLPDEDGRYRESPEMVAQAIGRFLGQGWLNLVGGCCGTTPAHVTALARVAAGAGPRAIPAYRRSFVSGIDPLEIEDSIRPVLVGERTNVIGSRKFKELIDAGRLEEASEIARRQVKGGAQVIDVCLANPDRDELGDMLAFLEQVIRKVKVPLMIDSTDPKVVAAALPLSQGKAIINSVNLEDGEERFAQVVPLVRRFGAALVVGCIDEDKTQGMAVTRQRKLEVARRSFDILTGKYGMAPEDLYFDPLVFPCATGDRQYLGSARETVEGIRLIRAALPGVKTIAGVSNVSFGLPPAGREVVNSVFLYHCTRAGLDLAIVNSEKIERYATIAEEDRRLAEAVLFETSDAVLAEFTSHFRERREKARDRSVELSLDERLAAYIVEGSKDGLSADLDRALQERRPLDIINGPLMAGMDEVGRLFNRNELIVAEVLQSAEAMKAAVRHLEPHMERAETASRGKILLATVKGDVHDIGKNLVEIILANNGYEVINLGIKVPPHELVEAARRHQPDLIGLSGLLVKSAQMMVVTAEELRAAGIDRPILVGGAALTRSFTLKRIAPAYGATVAYARDAMQGLELCGRLLDPSARAVLEAELAAQARALAAEAPVAPAAAPRPAARSARVRVLEADELPRVGDFSRQVLRQVPLDPVWPYINPAMLYNKHLGFKGKWESELRGGNDKARALDQVVESVKDEARKGALEGRAVWRFFEAASEGNAALVFRPGEAEPAARLDFPRQAGDDGLCIADFLRPIGHRPRDTVALLVTTAGVGVRQRCEELKQRGEYLRGHVLQSLALETAEALAEWLHGQIRASWGFADRPEMTMADRWQARYRGRRYSFGYPACPSLEDQAHIWSLLAPDEIGVSLTDGFMMEPEASVSALVVHHPEAVYFSVGRD